MERKQYRGHYPTAARFLIEEGVSGLPRQFKKDLRWASGIDIVYKLKGLTPVNFQKYSDTLLLLALQEAGRYIEYKWKFASFRVRLGRLKKGRDLPEIVDFQASMHDDPEIMVYGPGYEVPQRFFLKDKVEDIIDIAKRYKGKVRTQIPYRVVGLTINIRDPYP